MENVRPDNYTVRAEHVGFAETVMNGVTVAARQDVRLTLALKVAGQSSTVEVTAAADQINSENAAISDLKDNLLMTQLPLNNRATTTSPLGALGLSSNVQTDSSGNIALGGASSSMVNFSVDGISTANVQAEWRSAGCLSVAGRNRGRQGHRIQQQRGVFAGRRRDVHD